MSRTTTLTAAGAGVLTAGHLGRYEGPTDVLQYEDDRPVKPVAAVADDARADAIARPGALDLLLFSFAAGSGWGPARRWRFMSRRADDAQAPVY